MLDSIEGGARAAKQALVAATVAEHKAYMDMVRYQDLLMMDEDAVTDTVRLQEEADKARVAKRPRITTPKKTAVVKEKSPSNDKSSASSKPVGKPKSPSPPKSSKSS